MFIEGERKRKRIDTTTDKRDRMTGEVTTTGHRNPIQYPYYEQGLDMSISNVCLFLSDSFKGNFLDPTAVKVS
jgi:hypothetical protein